MPAPRRLTLPPPGSPHWLSKADPPGGLLYLAWGKRQFGISPIEPTRHHGWIYAVVLSGNPRLHIGKSSVAVPSGKAVIVGPDATAGWGDADSNVCEMLVWVWKRAPDTEQFADPASFWVGRMNSDTLASVGQLHSIARAEILRLDALSGRWLASIQTQLDVLYLRSMHGRVIDSVTHAARLQLANEWMARHLNLRDPIRRLADYLGVSSMTLQRWYRKYAGRTPRDALEELKLREAQQRLARAGMSVKRVALELGYLHPGDFSRAYRRYFGYSPSAHHKEDFQKSV